MSQQIVSNLENGTLLISDKFDINASVNINDYATAAISNATGTIGPQFQYMIWNNINLENMSDSINN